MGKPAPRESRTPATAASRADTIRAVSGMGDNADDADDADDAADDESALRMMVTGSSGPSVVRDGVRDGGYSGWRRGVARHTPSSNCSNRGRDDDVEFAGDVVEDVVDVVVGRGVPSHDVGRGRRPEESERVVRVEATSDNPTEERYCVMSVRMS